MPLFNLIVTLSFQAEDINEADEKSDQLLDLVEEEGYLAETAAVEQAVGIDATA